MAVVRAGSSSAAAGGLELGALAEDAPCGVEGPQVPLAGMRAWPGAAQTARSTDLNPLAPPHCLPLTPR